MQIFFITYPQTIFEKNIFTRHIFILVLFLIKKQFRNRFKTLLKKAKN